MKKIRLPLVLGFLSIQCSSEERDCSMAVYPFFGQSAVATNSTIRFYVRSISEEQPGFLDLPQLIEVQTGESVEVDVDINLEEALITLTPVSPLKENTEYQTEGVRFSESRHFRQNPGCYGYHLSTTSSVFTTESKPSILGHTETNEANRMAILLSEPVLDEDVERFTTSSPDIEPESFVFDEVDPQNPHVVYYLFERTESSYYYIDFLEISGPGLRAKDSTDDPIPFNIESTLQAPPHFMTGSFCSSYYGEE